MHRATRVTWSCSSGNLLKVTCPVYATVHVYTGRKIRPCLNGHPVCYRQSGGFRKLMLKVTWCYIILITII